MDIILSIIQKPIKGDWNGSGMHANFSNSTLRECGSQEIYEKNL